MNALKSITGKISAYFTGNVKPLPAALSFLLPGAFLVVRPFGLDLSQSFLFGALLQVILLWSASFVGKEIASAYLLLVFLLVGNASPVQVFAFPLSSNFVLIAASFLLSAGISKSGLAERLASLSFSRFVRTPRNLVLFSFLGGSALIFLIPQPFPRAVIMASLYSGFLSKTRLSETEKAVLVFSIFAASTVTSMLFLQGDIVLNNVALAFADASLSSSRWVAYMFVPSAVIAIATYFGFIRVFGVGKTDFFVPAGDIASDRDGSPLGRDAVAAPDRDGRIIVSADAVGTGTFTVFLPGSGSGSDGGKTVPGTASAVLSRPSLTRAGKYAAIISLLVVVFWFTESLHGISGAWPAAGGVFLLFAFRVLSIRDLREINLSLVLFLTAAFSIGKVLAANGIASALNDAFFQWLPVEGSLPYFPVLTVLGMLLHMLLGSSITTLSMMVPSLALETAGFMDGIVVALFSYTVTSMHYVLPIHHVTVMIGAGKGFYSQKETVRFGLFLTALVPVAVNLVFIPWWKLVGVM